MNLTIGSEASLSKCETVCTNQDGVAVLSGEAVVLLPRT